jgi:hypothetical protein
LQTFYDDSNDNAVPFDEFRDDEDYQIDERERLAWLTVGTASDPEMDTHGRVADVRERVKKRNRPGKWDSTDTTSSSYSSHSHHSHYSHNSHHSNYSNSHYSTYSSYSSYSGYPDDFPHQTGGLASSNMLEVPQRRRTRSLSGDEFSQLVHSRMSADSIDSMDAFDTMDSFPPTEDEVPTAVPPDGNTLEPSIPVERKKPTLPSVVSHLPVVHEGWQDKPFSASNGLPIILKRPPEDEIARINEIPSTDVPLSISFQESRLQPRPTAEELPEPPRILFPEKAHVSSPRLFISSDVSETTRNNEQISPQKVNLSLSS